MREQDHSARFRLTPIAAAFMVAFVTACGGGGSGGSSDDDDDTSETSAGEDEAVAATTASQVGTVANGMMAGSEAAEDFDGDTEALTASLSEDLQHQARTLVQSGQTADAIGDQDCTNAEGSLEVTESDAGLIVEADNCQIAVDEDDVEGDGNIDLQLTVDGRQEVRNDAPGEVVLDSDDFSIELSVVIEGFEFEISEDESFDIPDIGPITGSFTSDGGYETSTEAGSFSMQTEHWAMGFGFGCGDPEVGFNFEMNTSALSLESEILPDQVEQHEFDGTIGWVMEADVWDSAVDTDVTYETVEPLLVAAGNPQPHDGKLEVHVNGQTVEIEYAEGGVIFVDGEPFDQEDLAQLQAEEFGGNAEQAVMENCIAGDFEDF